MRMFWAFARNLSHAGEQTPVLFPGELLPIDIYDVYDSFLSFPIHFSVSHRIIFQFTHADDSRESVVLEYMDQCHMLQCHDG